MKKQFKMLQLNFKALALIAAIMLFIGGCSKDSMDNPEEYVLSGEISEIWPIVLPDDIIPFPGVINDVVGSGSYIRIFYSNVSDRTVIAYATAMEKKGFTCDFFVYTIDQWGSVGRKTTNRKNFEGVKMRKGSLDLTLDLTGFNYDMHGLPDFSDRDMIPWPKSWADLPKPEGVYIDGTWRFKYDVKVLSADIPYFNALQGFSDEQQEGKRKVAEAYINLLLSSGFREATAAELQLHQMNESWQSVYFINDKMIVEVMKPDDTSHSTTFRFKAIRH